MRERKKEWHNFLHFQHICFTSDNHQDGFREVFCPCCGDCKQAFQLVLVTQTRCEALGQVCSLPGDFWLRMHLGPLQRVRISRNTWSWDQPGSIEIRQTPRTGVWQLWARASEMKTQLRNVAHFNTSLNIGESLSICFTMTSGKREWEKKGTGLQESHLYF